MIDLNAFLDSLLTTADKTPFSDYEKKELGEKNLVDIIYHRVTDKDFRFSSVDAETTSFIKKYIETATKEKKPIRMYILFGGYKQARLKSAPCPEWAEIFNVNFVLKAASLIESVYEYGVDVIYRGDELITTWIDNLPVKNRKAYKEKFDQILSVFRKGIPKGRRITVKYELTSETSPESKLFPLMEKLYPKYLEKFNRLDKDTQEHMVQKSLRNQDWDGEKDLTKLSESERAERGKWAALMHDAFLEADITLAKEYFDNGISITFRRGVPGCIHYGSCSSSTVQFWAGEGFLVKRGDRLIPWIYSNEQINGLAWDETKVGVKDFNDLGLETIRVIKES